MKFDFNQIRRTELLICRVVDGKRSFHKIPVRPEVGDLLLKSLKSTIDSLGGIKKLGKLKKFDPADAIQDRSQITLAEPYLTQIRSIYDTKNVPNNANALTQCPSEIYFYILRTEDKSGYRLIAARRASGLKSAIKQQFLGLTGDELYAVEDKLFRLDEEFSFFTDGEDVFILHATDFTYIASIDDELRKQAAKIMVKLDKTLAGIDLTKVTAKIAKGASKRTSRLLASIANRGDLNKIDNSLLLNYCSEFGIKMKDVDGKHQIHSNHTVKFLQILDRRLYTLELIKGTPEHYEAASRQELA